jgi:hypothetical protein
MNTIKYQKKQPKPQAIHVVDFDCGRILGKHGSKWHSCVGTPRHFDVIASSQAARVWDLRWSQNTAQKKKMPTTNGNTGIGIRVTTSYITRRE